MCCGKHRQQINTPAPPRPAAPTPGVPFEYQGATALTLVSPLTSRKYRFERPGAQIAVDPRDVPWLTFVPQLKRARA